MDRTYSNPRSLTAQQPKGPDPSCPLSSALHEMAQRIEHRVYALREMRGRLAA